MHRIDSATASTDENGAGKDGWTEGSPSPLVPPTAGTAAWFNDVQENLAQAIELELTLSKGTHTQLRDLIYAREDKRILAAWRELPISSTQPIHCVLDSGSLIVSAGGNGKIQHSVMGDSEWTEVSAGSAYTGTLYSLALLGSTWCAVGTSGGIQTSTDGASWTARTPAAAFAGTFYAVAASGTTLVAVGTSGTIQTSTDGTTWTARTAAGGYAADFTDVAYDSVAGSFCAVGQNGEVQVSSDGTTWTSAEGSQPALDYARVCARPAGGFLVAKHDGASNIYIRRSTAAGAGVFAAQATLATATTRVYDLVVGCDSRRYAMLLDGGIIRSASVSDTTTWSAEDRVVYSAYGMTYARKSFIAVGGSELSTTRHYRTERHA